VTLNVLTDINMLNSMSVIVVRDNASATFRGAMLLLSVSKPTIIDGQSRGFTVCLRDG